MKTAIGDGVADNRVVAGVVTHGHGTVASVVQGGVFDAYMGCIFKLNNALPVFFARPVHALRRAFYASAVTVEVGEL